MNYNGYVYPMWIQIIGYMITGKDYWINMTLSKWEQLCVRLFVTGCTLIAVPVSALSELAWCYSGGEPLSSLLRPTQQWGPNHYHQDVM